MKLVKNGMSRKCNYIAFFICFPLYQQKNVYSKNLGNDRLIESYVFLPDMRIQVQITTYQKGIIENCFDECLRLTSFGAPEV